MKAKYLAGSETYCTVAHPVNAPLFKRIFDYDGKCCLLRIATTGFYRLFFNGTELTKGFLAPYISNPDQIVFQDFYDLSDRILPKDNVLCVLLGNGFSNCMDFGCWEFESAPFRAAPSFSLEITDGAKTILVSDEKFSVTDSPIIFDDIRCGERYDARLEQADILTSVSCSDAFRPPIIVPSPKGTVQMRTSDPIVICDRLRPCAITKSGAGYIFSFPENNSGLCRLTVDGKSGQRIDLYYSELMQNGAIVTDNLGFWGRPAPEYIQHDVYICRDGHQTYTPSFTYHGFQYVYVEGITAEQATQSLLEYLVIHSDLRPRMQFSCSDEVLNRLMDCTRRSDVSNFHHFPTDCPHREKNGWLGDGWLGAEHLLLSFDARASYRQWLRCICLSQKESGELPGIVPTAGWGYEWGNGPWLDSIIVRLPYQLYRFYGDTDAIHDCKDAVLRYYTHYRTKINSNGLVAYGLPDWLVIGTMNDASDNTPLEVTDSLFCMDLWNKAAELFDVIGEAGPAEMFRAEAARLRGCFRAKYVIGGRLLPQTQTAYAMTLATDIFDRQERQSALQGLLDTIEAAECHFNIGMPSIAYLYRVLSECGRSDLIYRMVTNPTFPSFAAMLKPDTTTLWECFAPLPEDIHRVFLNKGRVYSYNHACWGSVLTWILKDIGALEVLSPSELRIAPQLPEALTFAETDFENAGCRIHIRIDRTQRGITVKTKNYGFSGIICLNGRKAALTQGDQTVSEQDF